MSTKVTTQESTLEQRLDVLAKEMQRLCSESGAQIVIMYKTGEQIACVACAGAEFKAYVSVLAASDALKRG